MQGSSTTQNHLGWKIPVAAHPEEPLGSSQHAGGGNCCQGAQHRLELSHQRQPHST